MTTQPSSPIHLAVASLVAALIIIAPAAAEACGAMVPTQDLSTPSVVHDAESMLYVVGDDGRLTVYQGRSIETDADEFAWLLPVPGEPDVELGPAQLFEHLADATRPTFEMTDRSDGNCPTEVQTDKLVQPDGTKTDYEPTTRSAGDPSRSTGDTGAVRQVSSGQTGPFDHVTIATREGTDRPGERALDWLRDEGYNLAALDEQLLREYLEQGLNLLAFRLRPDADSDEIRPIAITVDADRAMSPMRLAAAGADDETNILVWVAANHPAVPEGYAHVQLNESLLDWRRGGNNYHEIAAEAVREAGGQAFITDSTIKTSELGDLLISGDSADRWRKSADSDSVQPEKRRQLLEAILDIEVVESADKLGTIWSETIPLADNLIPELTTAVRLNLEAQDSSRQESDDTIFIETDDGLRPAEQTLEQRVRECIIPAIGEWSGQRNALIATIEVADSREVVLSEPSSGAQLSSFNSALGDVFRDCVSASLEQLADNFRNIHRKRLLYPGDQLTIQVVMSLISGQSLPSRSELISRLSEEQVAEVDLPQFLKRVDDEILMPFRNLQKRLESVDYITRLSTTMSPDDMSKDVYFAEAPGADKLPTKRTAERIIKCGPDATKRDERDLFSSEKTHLRITRDWIVDPPRGTAIEGHGRGWPVSIGDVDAAYSITHYGDESEQ